MLFHHLAMSSSRDESVGLIPSHGNRKCYTSEKLAVSHFRDSHPGPKQLIVLAAQAHGVPSL